MKMKNLRKLSLLSVLIAIIFCSCEGPVGPAGPAGASGQPGAAGNTGSAGAAGVAGKDGNANVVSTTWRKLDLSNATSNAFGGNITSINVIGGNTAEPLFTKEVLDKDLIYTYAKLNSLNFLPDGTISQFDRFVSINSSSSAAAAFLIPGRDKNKEENYRYLTLNPSAIGVNYFSLTGLFSLRRSLFNLTTQANEVILPAEFVGKDLNFHKDNISNIVSIRHVIVKANIAGRKFAVDMNDYEAVKAAFNLKD